MIARASSLATRRKSWLLEVAVAVVEEESPLLLFVGGKYCFCRLSVFIASMLHAQVLSLGGGGLYAHRASFVIGRQQGLPPKLLKASKGRDKKMPSSLLPSFCLMKWISSSFVMLSCPLLFFDLLLKTMENQLLSFLCLFCLSKREVRGVREFDPLITCPLLHDFHFSFLSFMFYFLLRDFPYLLCLTEIPFSIISPPCAFVLLYDIFIRGWLRIGQPNQLLGQGSRALSCSNKLKVSRARISRGFDLFFFDFGVSTIFCCILLYIFGIIPWIGLVSMDLCGG